MTSRPIQLLAPAIAGTLLGFAIVRALPLLQNLHAAASERIGPTWPLLLIVAMGTVVTALLQLSGNLDARRAGVLFEKAEELAPSIGLLGTVFAMIEALSEFDLAPEVQRLVPAVGRGLWSTGIGSLIWILAYSLRNLANLGCRVGARKTSVMLCAMALLPGVAPSASAEPTSAHLSRALLPHEILEIWDSSRLRPSNSDLAPKPEQPTSSSRLIRAIHEEAERAGIHPLMAEAIARAESDLKPQAISHTGCCRGIYQLEARTAKTLGVADPFDPHENIAAGVSLLRSLLARYRDLSTALVAWNAGTARAKAFQRDRRAPIPAETRRFIERVATLFGKLQEESL